MLDIQFLSRAVTSFYINKVSTTSVGKNSWPGKVTFKMVRKSNTMASQGDDLFPYSSLPFLSHLHHSRLN